MGYINKYFKDEMVFGQSTEVKSKGGPLVFIQGTR